MEEGGTMCWSCGSSSGWMRERAYMSAESVALSDAPLDVREVQPDLDAAKVRTFRTDGCGNAGAKMAGRTDIAREFGLNLAKLGDFIHGGVVNLLLGVKARAHGPFVQ